MNYLQRLVRRLSGSVPEHSLRPNVRRWSDGPDPFENWSIAPATVPLTSKRHSDRTGLVAGDDARPRKNRRDFVETEPPAKKTERGTTVNKLDTAESRPAVVIRENQPVEHGGLFDRDKATAPKVFVQADTGIRNRRPKRLQPLQDRGSAEVDTADSKTLNKKGESNLFGRLRQKASIGGQIGRISPKVDVSESNTSTVNAALAPLPLQPAHARILAAGTPRRKKTAKSGTEAPRLIIGKLEVDVVAVDAKPISHRVTAPPARKKKPIRTRDVGRGAAKMKFGLGQM